MWVSTAVYEPIDYSVLVIHGWICFNFALAEGEIEQDTVDSTWNRRQYLKARNEKVSLLLEKNRKGKNVKGEKGGRVLSCVLHYVVACFPMPRKSAGEERKGTEESLLWTGTGIKYLTRPYGGTVFLAERFFS